ncbi:MAG: hypothetical protein IV100_10210 [Myxococcales bacterium]|nr:hypothetical protein [Myxococcales bacterium]
MTLRHNRDSDPCDRPERRPALALVVVTALSCATSTELTAGQHGPSSSRRARKPPGSTLTAAHLDASATLAGGYDTNVHRAPPPIPGHEPTLGDVPVAGSLFLLESQIRFTGEARGTGGTTGARIRIPLSDEHDGADGRELSRDRSEVALDGSLDLHFGPKTTWSLGVALARTDRPADLGAATADPDGARRGHRTAGLAVEADTGLRVDLVGPGSSLEPRYTLDVDYTFAATRHDDLGAADMDRHQVDLDAAWHFRRHASLEASVTFDAVLRPESPETASATALWLDARLGADSGLGSGFFGGLEVAWTDSNVAAGTVAGRLWFGVDIASFAVVTLDLERRYGPSVWGDAMTRHIAAFRAQLDAPARLPWLLADLSIAWSHVAFGTWTTPLTVPVDRYVTHEDRRFELLEASVELGIVARSWLELALRYRFDGRLSAFGVETVADTGSAVTTGFGTDRALAHEALLLIRFRTPRR